MVMAKVVDDDADFFIDAMSRRRRKKRKLGSPLERDSERYVRGRCFFCRRSLSCFLLFCLTSTEGTSTSIFGVGAIMYSSDDARYTGYNVPLSNRGWSISKSRRSVSEEGIFFGRGSLHPPKDRILALNAPLERKIVFCDLCTCTATGLPRKIEENEQRQSFSFPHFAY